VNQSDQYEQLVMIYLSETFNVPENHEQHSRHQERVEQVPDQSE
jgi:hypothetical protein